MSKHVQFRKPSSLENITVVSETHHHKNPRRHEYRQAFIQDQNETRRRRRRNQRRLRQRARVAPHTARRGALSWYEAPWDRMFRQFSHGFEKTLQNELGKKKRGGGHRKKKTRRRRRRARRRKSRR